MPGHEPLALEEAVILGYNVERLRTTQELSKTMFANMAGISRPTLNKIEQGLADPQLSIIRRIADALNVTVRQLLTPPRINTYHPRATYRLAPLPESFKDNAPITPESIADLPTGPPIVQATQSSEHTETRSHNPSEIAAPLERRERSAATTAPNAAPTVSTSQSAASHMRSGTNS